MNIQLFLDISLNDLDKVSKNEFYAYISNILQDTEIRVFINQELRNDLISGEYDQYLSNILRVLEKLIKQSDTWEKKSIANNNHQLYYQLQGLAIPLDINGTVKAEITERQIEYDEICALIIFDTQQKENIYTIRQGLHQSPTISQFTQVLYFQLLDKEKLWRFLENAKQKRIFRHHTKHDYIGYKKNTPSNPDDRKSKNDAKINRLLFSVDKQQEYAEILLKTAITDQSTEKLYNLDFFPEVEGGKGKLVEFMPEKSTPYTYHAYHLEDISDAGDVDRFLDYLSNDLRDRLKEWLEKTAS